VLGKKPYKRGTAELALVAARYIPKALSSKVLIGALNLILSGVVYLPAEAISGSTKMVEESQSGVTAARKPYRST
jgi:DNA-binding NarL/FixJ family response regulator